MRQDPRPLPEVTDPERVFLDAVNRALQYEAADLKIRKTLYFGLPEKLQVKSFK